MPKDEAELIALNRRVRADDPAMQGNRAFLTQRDKCFDPNETYFLTCANCQLICWEKREDRIENQRLLVTSGIVVLSAKSGRMAVPRGEAVDINTPYGLKVAVPSQERPTMVTPKEGDLSGYGSVVDRPSMDIQVLSYIASKNR